MIPDIFEKMLISRVGFIVKYDSVNLFSFVHSVTAEKDESKLVTISVCQMHTLLHVQEMAGPPFLVHSVKYASNR